MHTLNQKQNKTLNKMRYGEKHDGVSIVIVSYNRPSALKILLIQLLKQKLTGIKTELIIVNNSQGKIIKPSRLSILGRLLNKFDEPKILNSTYNWGPGIRYAIATASKYQTILFFDDDIYPIDPFFIRKLYNSFKSLRPHDILTCWADLWVNWDKNQLSTVSMNFSLPEITDITEVDYCGTGISMFNKNILMHPNMLNIPREYKFADTAWFPWIPNIIFGTRKYYFPSFRMLKFHKQKTLNALCKQDGYDDFIFLARNKMLDMGYKPVLSRSHSMKFKSGSPEERASKTIPIITRKWR